MRKKKDKKLKVRVTFNENISEEEEQSIWNSLFDLLLKKKPSNNTSVANERITKLSDLFAEYRIYPASKYVADSPARCFQRLYPKSYYASEIETFLEKHKYNPEQRGSDLPWWGQKYFSKGHGKRVMIISQDSLAPDAGSAVFWAFLYPMLSSRDEYAKFINCLGGQEMFKYNRWKTILDQFNDWKIDLEFCYITDASKVYKKGSWKDRDFDHERSKELLKREIELCNPDAIILLGTSSLTLLFPEVRYTDAVESGEPLFYRNKKCIVAPFPGGQGPTQKNFKKRLEIATSLITRNV